MSTKWVITSAADRIALDDQRAGEIAFTVSNPTPNADRAARQIVCLPFWGRLTDSQIGRVVEAVKAVARRPALAG